MNESGTICLMHFSSATYHSLYSEVCLHALVCGHAHVCTYMCRSEGILGSWSWVVIPPTTLFWDIVSNSPSTLAWLTGEPQWSSYLCLLSPGVTSGPSHPALSYMGSGIELRSVWLPGKLFTGWTISLALSHSFEHPKYPVSHIHCEKDTHSFFSIIFCISWIISPKCITQLNTLPQEVQPNTFEMKGKLFESIWQWGKNRHQWSVAVLKSPFTPCNSKFLFCLLAHGPMGHWAASKSHNHGQHKPDTGSGKLEAALAAGGAVLTPQKKDFARVKTERFDLKVSYCVRETGGRESSKGMWIVTAVTSSCIQIGNAETFFFFKEGPDPTLKTGQAATSWTHEIEKSKMTFVLGQTTLLNIVFRSWSYPKSTSTQTGGAKST